MSIVIRTAKVCADSLFSESLKATYIRSSIGSRSVPVDRLANKNVISFKFFKFSSEQILLV